MNRSLIIAGLALPLMAFQCGQQRPSVEFPVLPDLSAETVRPCPPADAVTGTLGDLATKDAGLAIAYARCQARAATAVGAYQTAQRLLKAASDLANGKKPDQGPAKPR
jgi:hypothetical protein